MQSFGELLSSLEKETFRCRMSGSGKRFLFRRLQGPWERGREGTRARAYGQIAITEPRHRRGDTPAKWRSN